MTHVRLRVALILFASSPALHAQFQATPSFSPLGAAPVGSPVAIRFNYSGSVRGPVTFRFEVQSPASTSFTVVKDYDQETSFLWDQDLNEGSYSLRVTARDYATGLTSQVVQSYVITSRLINGNAVVNATTHPLVALFSAPACLAGNTIKVGFYSASFPAILYTNSESCGAGSMNFLVAGLRPNTTYSMNYYVTAGSTTVAGPATLTFQSGAVPASFQSSPVTFPVHSGGTSTYERFQFNNYQETSQAYAFDLSGNIVWYWPNGQGPQLHRLLPDGTFLGSWGVTGDWTSSGVWGRQVHDQLLAQFDMLGNVVQMTNVDRVNEQLPAIHPITHFNHDSIRLQNGNTIAIADEQEVVPTGTQGNGQPIGVIGFMLVELDQNFQVIWYWDSFDHAGGGGQLDLNRPATLNDQCSAAGQEGCPPVLLTNPSNDWLHANTLQYQADGSLVVSLRDQDWLIDIDFGNGAGTQNILWRLGREGDFKIASNLPYPWFSHQHDAEFHNGALELLTIFDNGNTRVTEAGTGYSRGQAYNVDVPDKTVTIAVSVELGVYSPALGSAQILQNGDYMFLAGQVHCPKGYYDRAIELTPSGTIVFEDQVYALSYRCYRIPDFYTPPNGAGLNLP